jgi:hypothetical protein
MSSSAFTEFFIIGVMAAIIVMYIKGYYGEVEMMKGEGDGRQYIVRKLPDSKKAADLLSRINLKLQRTIDHMQKTFPKDADVRRLAKNFDPDAISEGGAEVGYTSYSVNKGEKIVLCIRQSGGEFVDENILMYVALHELAHLMTKEVGHPKSFWDNFKRIINEAIKIGVYTKVDFDKEPESYCGITISSSVV